MNLYQGVEMILYVSCKRIIEKSNLYIGENKRGKNGICNCFNGNDSSE